MAFQKTYTNGKTKLLADETIVQYNRDLFCTFFEWEEEKLKRTNGLPELDESSYNTLYCYINKFRNTNAWFKNKAWNVLTEADIRQVYNDLEDGVIKTKRGKRFEDRKSYYNKIFTAIP